MKKKFLNALLAGAVIVTSTGLVACGYDDDEIKSRVTVLEGLVGELQQTLATEQAKGAAVKSAEQAADGTWTLTLSDGKVITIKPTTGGGAGGGSSVSVVENPNNFIITVDGTEYVLPKGAAAAQLVYSPQFEDGIEVYTGDILNVQFLMSPALTNVDGAVADIKEAHQLQTRASSLFSVEGALNINGDFITVPVKATEAVSGQSYAVSIQVSKDGKDYISNYFTIKIGANDFKAEDLEDYTFAASITDATKEDGTLADGSATHTWTATLPTDLTDDFTFASFFTNVPDGVVYEIASQDKQVGNAAGGAYDVLKSSLAADGKWVLSGRPGCAFPDGFLVNLKKDGTVKMKVKFIFNDPLASVDWRDVYAAGTGGHIEVKGATNDGSDILAAGVNDVDLPLLFTNAADDNSLIPLMHDGGRFINEEYTQYNATLRDKGDLIYHDGERYVTGEVGQKYAKNSRGLYWVTYQLSFGSSNRRNLSDRPADEGSDDNITWCGGTCNGELGQWDGIPGQAYEKFGVGINEQGHLVTTANYKGWCMRAGLWCKYEYAYGEATIGGDALVWAWFNRRSCPAGVNDYDVDKTNPDNANLQ